MLLGQFSQKVGQKHRLVLPKQFRDGLGQPFILTIGYEGCLLLISSEDWRQLVQQLQRGSLFDHSSRLTARLLLGSATQITCDNQGRFVVPAITFDQVISDSEVVFVGLGSWVEVWDSQRWQEQQQKIQAQADALAQQVANIGWREDPGHD